jgi:UrcA family protein
MSTSTKIALILLTVAAAGPLYAGDAWDKPASKTVSYTELDLARPAADEKLYQRIRAAAREVCESLEGRGLEKLKPHQQCLDNAISRAVAQVNHPKLTAYFAAHNPHKPLPVAAILPKQNGPLQISSR